MTDQIGLKVAYGALMTMAVVPIYAGSVASLNGMKKPANAPKIKRTSPLDDSEDEEDISESITASDAWTYPLIGSAVLFSLYLLIRVLDKEYIDYMIKGYFTLMGTGALATTSLLTAKKIIPTCLLSYIEKYKITLSKSGKSLYRKSFTVVHGVLLLVSILLAVFYATTRNWIVSNLIGISLSVSAIKLLSLDTFKTGMILLSGLFLYDIFWVFGTDVMVSVAKGIDAPIKVIWPRDIFGFLQGTSNNFAMLGLGDIVIPGIFVALCLRYDRHTSWQRQPSGNFRSTAFSKPYFTACSIAYVAGLGATMAVMHFFNAAQPALLYLSPACILSVLITAAVRGEFGQVMSYSAEEKKEDEEKTNGKKRNQKKATASVEASEASAEENSQDYVTVSPVQQSPAPSKSSKKKSSKSKK